MEFEQDFSTDVACLEYIDRLRWPDGFRCPRCSNSEAWKTGRGLYHCKKCGYQSSVTAGTIFQDTRKPLRLWFRAIWYITNQKHGISALGLQRVLGLGSYRTAWFWMHKLRHAMVRPGRDRLSGVVEVDETYIGGKRTGEKRGRGTPGKIPVVIAVQEDDGRIGRIRLFRVPDTSANSLAQAVQACIEPGSVVRTDGFNHYGLLSGLGYTHVVTRKEPDIGDNLLPMVNLVASLLKRWLLGTHQGAVHLSHLDYYLDEFTFRFNRRRSRSRGKLFYRLVQQAVMVDPLPGNSISPKNSTG